MAILPDQARSLVGLGRVFLALGRHQDGAECLGQARGLWAAMRARPQIAEIDALLADAENN